MFFEILFVTKYFYKLCCFSGKFICICNWWGPLNPILGIEPCTFLLSYYTRPPFKEMFNLRQPKSLNSLGWA